MNKVLVSCIICGKELQRAVGSTYNPICGYECRLKRRRKRWKELRPYYGRAINCSACGAEFIPNKYVAYKARFCSIRCKQKAGARAAYHRNRDAKLKRSTAWRIQRKWNGNWYATLRRDEFQCQLCGNKEQLLVHHKDGEGETGANNHEMNNLQTLCCSCHTQMHRLSLVYKEGKLYVEGRILRFFPDNDSFPVSKQHNLTSL